MVEGVKMAGIDGLGVGELNLSYFREFLVELLWTMFRNNLGGKSFLYIKVKTILKRLDTVFLS